ncbi:hypothetical protein LTR62_006287 [Meristemomyces frigidus]|uniref:Uncharacterized protein n=1 Tax=Meristemomyces frigidus TaxID=1508187 RepID=A0AAN7TCN0_9PEZI|nr:hypothetical protein LTR62_006287 [Meristemomyces frigidus]
MAATANGSWAYAVPLDESNGNAPPPHTSAVTPITGTRSRNHSQRRPSDHGIFSDSETVHVRKMSHRRSSASAGRKRSRQALRESLPDNTPREEGVDDSAWIHRDKLAQIEIQEMAEAGIPITGRQSRRSGSTSRQEGMKGRTSRSQSRTRKGVSRDAHEEQMEELNGQYATFDEYHRKRVSTIPAADDQEREEEQAMDTELRTPDEVASEHAMQSRVIRPSTSRIPLAKVSTVPVSQQVVDRDSPLERGRNGSGAWSNAWDEGQYDRRARGNSVGSQVLLDEYGHTNGDGTNPDENSPPMARGPNKATPASRKPTAAAGSNSRPTSSHAYSKHKPNNAAAALARPVSRSGPGHKSRPSTGYIPDNAEAPWIASMYKPDPRLPPEEQMLPTHAKRMQQEQWEREGRMGMVYDKDLRLQSDSGLQQPLHERLMQRRMDESSGGAGPRNHDFSPATNDPSPQANMNTPDRPWPLSPSISAVDNDARSTTGSVRPGTSGGYKITPTITNPAPTHHDAAPPLAAADGHKRVELGNSSYVTASANGADEKEVVGRAESSKAEKKRGCGGCCAVM